MNNINNKRVSASTANLTKEVRARPNYEMLDLTKVLHLVFDGTRVVGVRVRREGQEFDVSANEVIISTGALHSPP